jgi:thiamine pyrophosphokinase
MTCYLIIGNNIDLKNWSYEKDATLIGVDRGAFKAVEAGLTLDLAYGDFDSVTEKEMALIQKGSKKIKKLNPIKDITDTYGAYLEAGKADKIVILGGIQGFRVEHFLALLNIVKKDPRVEIVDASSSIKHLSRPKRTLFRFFKGWFLLLILQHRGGHFKPRKFLLSVKELCAKRGRFSLCFESLSYAIIHWPNFLIQGGFADDFFA